MAKGKADTGPRVDRFGRDEVSWRPSPDDDPILVASLHLQHRLLTAARRSWPSAQPGSELNGRTLADVLGMPGSIRAAEKRLAGKQLLQLDDVVRLALCLGDEVLTAVPRQAADLIPEPYRTLLGSWTPGRGVAPTFQRPSPGGQDWANVVNSLAEVLDAEFDDGRGHLLTTGAVTHALVRALNESGVDPNMIELDERPQADSRVSTLAIGPSGDIAAARVAYLPDQSGTPRMIAERIKRIVSSAADDESDHHIVVLVAGQAATRQLHSHLPDFLTARLDEPIVIQFQSLARPSAAGEVPHDLDAKIIGRAVYQSRCSISAVLTAKRR